jgi:hypothetical protein
MPRRASAAIGRLVLLGWCEHLLSAPPGSPSRQQCCSPLFLSCRNLFQHSHRACSAENSVESLNHWWSWKEIHVLELRRRPKQSTHATTRGQLESIKCRYK